MAMSFSSGTSGVELPQPCCKSRGGAMCQGPDSAWAGWDWGTCCGPDKVPPQARYGRGQYFAHPCLNLRDMSHISLTRITSLFLLILLFGPKIFLCLEVIVDQQYSINEKEKTQQKWIILKMIRVCEFWTWSIQWCMDINYSHQSFVILLYEAENDFNKYLAGHKECMTRPTYGIYRWRVKNAYYFI